MEQNSNPRKFRLTLFSFVDQNCYVKMDMRFMAESLAENKAAREIDGATDVGDTTAYRIQHTDTEESVYFPSQEAFADAFLRFS